MIYPKPASFYVQPAFEGDRGSPVHPALRDDQPVVLGVDTALGERTKAQLDLVLFRRFGRLRGEYIFLSRACLALDRNGAPIRTNYDPEEDTAHTSVFSQIETYCFSPDFFSIRDRLLEQWDQFALVSDIPIMSEWYGAKNYHHFMIRCIPQLRAYPDEPGVTIGVPQELLERPFQRDLIAQTIGKRQLIPLPQVFRARNPTLSYEPIAKEGIHWLRRTMGLRARKGERLIYIRRGPSMVGRKTGDLVETPEFLAFLEQKGFEVISFGGGELSIADQVKLLDGARVVLSAHGASLSNIVYLAPGVAVIELFARHWCHHSHMQLSMHVGLKHTSIICEINPEFNALPDIAVLNIALERSLDLTA